MSAQLITSAAPLEARRAAIAAALRECRESPRAVVSPPPAPASPAYPSEPRTAPAPVPATDPLITRLGETVARLTERLERLEDKVELMRDGDDAPLAWPVAVGGDSALDVPPVEIARRNSPAFDVLMGPSNS